LFYIRQNYIAERGYNAIQLVENFLNNIEDVDDGKFKLKAFEKHIKLIKSKTSKKDLPKAKMKKYLIKREDKNSVFKLHS